MASFERHRKRRIIVNDDSYAQNVKAKQHHYNDITDVQSFLDARVTRTFDTQVDTYVLDIGNETEPSWNKHEGELWPFLGSEARAFELAIEACHGKGMEIWASLRVNDIHDRHQCDRLEDSNDPLKAEHPEWIISRMEDRSLPEEIVESSLWTAWNFEHAEVREHRLGYIERVARAHDWDGFEIDFTRFLWNFPPGREIELAHHMTDFIRQARARLKAVGEERGRPYTFVVHVMDSPESSFFLGQDVETWLAEGLVDVLVVGSGATAYVLPMDRWRALGDKHGVPIYPSMDALWVHKRYKLEKRMHREGLKSVVVLHEVMRAGAAWWWANGADGIYLFNLFCQDRNVDWPEEKGLVTAPLAEVGDPATLAGKDKLYNVHCVDLPGFQAACDPPALPVPLEMMERKLPLQMGPDADDPKARFTIHILATGGDEDTKVYARLNHRLLSPSLEGGHYVAEVPDGLMRAGLNEVTVWCNKDISLKTRPRQTPSRLAKSPMIVYEVIVEVKY